MAWFINRAFCSKKIYILMWNGVTYFVGVYITKKKWNITCPLGDTKIWNFCVEKYFTHLFFNIPSEISYFQAAMYCKVLHVYIMYIDLFIHLSWLFTLHLIVDRQDVLLHILLLPTATHTAYSQYWDMVW